MKRTLRLLLALSLIASGPSMLAQDAAAPFRRTSPTPAPSEEATPAAEPTEAPRAESPQEEEEPRRAEPAATPTPAAVQTAPPAATPEATTQKPPTSTPPAERSSRRVLQGEPIRAAEPRPAGSRRPPPPQPEEEAARPEPTPRRERARTPKPTTRAEQTDRPPAPQPTRPGTLDYWDDDPGSAVKALERKWQKALVDKDVDTISKLLASDFVATSSTGKVGSKSTLLNAIRRDKNEYKSADARGMSVRMLGPRVAVVTGVATESGTTPDGKSFRNSRRFTDTWMLRNGKWLCVASQATELPNR